MFNILIVDDEIKITQVIKAYLDKEGYNTIVANNGEQALECFSKNSIDLMILDRMLPDISGEEICEKVRAISKVHIIMLTAKTEDSDKIDGFNIGCDDYVCKPFNVKELVLRVKAVFRKMDVENKDLLKFSDELEIDMNSHEVKVRGKKVELTNTEYKILLLFAKNQNKVFTRELWEMATECPVVFPSGIGVVGWMVPGGREIAVATSALMKEYDVAIWAHHGMFCSGEDFDLTFGLMHTVEKSAEILVKMLSMRPDKRQTISPQNFRDLAKDFKVTLPEKFLYGK